MLLHAYTQFLYSRPIGVQLSMTQNGDVYQNAVAERVNGILKIPYDFLLNQTFASIQQATTSVKQSISILQQRETSSQFGVSNSTSRLSERFARNSSIIPTVICTFLCKPILGLDTSLMSNSR